MAQPKDSQPKDTTKDKPIPDPLPMGVPYLYQPGNNYWYVPVVPAYVPAGTYYTVYAATRPVVVVTPSGPVATRTPTTPVVLGPSWALWPVSYPYPFASSGPVYGRYTWDYTGIPSGGYGWYSTNLPHYPYSYQYPTLAGRVWMGYGW
jgi:hypothetical protein